MTGVAKDLVEFYTEILRKNGITDEIKEVTVKVPELAGEQYASQCTEVTVHFFNKAIPPLEIFVKNTTANEQYAKQMEEVSMFEKEAQFFSSLLPDVLEFAEKHHGNNGSLKSLFPKCYLATHDTAIFKNLVHSGYTKLSRFTPHNLHTAELVITNLAKFHGTFRAYIQSIGEETFKAKYSHISSRNVWLEEGELINGTWIQQAVEGAIQILTRKPTNGSEEVLEFFKKYETKAMLKICPLFYLNNLRCSVVLSHGDFWNGNMMFTVKSETNIPQTCVFLDFQTINLSTPAQDLIFYIFFVMDAEVRKKNWKRLLSFYYEQVQQVMSQYGQKIQYSLSDLTYDFCTKSVAGFFFGLYPIFGFEALENVGGVQNSDGNALENLSATMSNSLDKLMDTRGTEFSKSIVKMYREYQEIEKYSQDD